MNDRLLPEQRVQEAEYSFPYHHLVELQPFALHRDLFWGQAYAAYLEAVIDELAKQPFESVIDIGCGDGKLLLEIRKRYPDKRLAGQDFSARALAFARAFAPDVDFYEQMPEETFDAFTLVEVLEHIPPAEIPAFLDDVKRHLNPGGVGILTVPSDARPVKLKHYQHFSEQSLRKTLEPHFRIESIGYLTKRCKLVQSLLCNRFFDLNVPRLRGWLYRYYKRHYLHATEKDGLRLIAVLRKPD